MFNINRQSNNETYSAVVSYGDKTESRLDGPNGYIDAKKLTSIFECLVCYDIRRLFIYMCVAGHLVCSTCLMSTQYSICQRLHGGQKFDFGKDSQTVTLSLCFLS